jgi:hypothetical protein
MTARLVEHTYRDGYGRRDHDRSFWIVECSPCLAVLNSGHHYPEHALHHARALAAEHNEEAHNIPSPGRN